MPPLQQPLQAGQDAHQTPSGARQRSLGHAEASGGPAGRAATGQYWGQKVVQRISKARGPAESCGGSVDRATTGQLRIMDRRWKL